MTAITQARTTRAALITDARRRGVTRLACETCGHKHPISRLGLGCNAAHPEIDGATCEGWDLAEVIRNPGDELTMTRTKAGLC